MVAIQIFDPALCCRSGVCGVTVDQALIDIAADIDWLKGKGITVERFNLAQEPLVFAKNPVVKTFLNTYSEQQLPLILVNDEIVLSGRYPSRNELATWAGIEAEAASHKASSCCQKSTSCC